MTEINLGNFKNCKIGSLLGVFNTDYKHCVGDVINGLMITSLSYKIYENRPRIRSYKYKCLKCGFDCGEHYRNEVLVCNFSISENDLSKGHGCSCCRSNTRAVVTDINSMWKTDYWMVELGVDEEFAKTHTKASNKIAPITCPDCGKTGFKNPSKIQRDKSISCICGDGFSYPEKFISSILNQLGVKYVAQLTKSTFKWCGNYRYDFFVDDKIIIEAHGMQHYGRGFDLFGGKTLEEEQNNDKQKMTIALDNGIDIDNYIVIDCSVSDSEFIKHNLLKSKLSQIYNLNNVDWIESSMFAMKNLSRLARDMFNDDSSMSTLQIGLKIGVGRKTVLKWLKNWANTGLCDYNPKDASRNNAINNSKIIPLKSMLFLIILMLGHLLLFQIYQEEARSY